MQEPFRLRVLKALTCCLQNIRPTNGYNHDLSDSVFRGRMFFGDSAEDEPPLVSILETLKPGDGQDAATDNTTSDAPWSLYIQGWVVDDQENPTDPAHLLMADVKLALAKEKQRKDGNSPDILGFGPKKSKGNCITNLTIGSGIVRPPEDDFSTKANFWLTITLEITEDASNPYV